MKRKKDQFNHFDEGLQQLRKDTTRPYSDAQKEEAARTAIENQRAIHELQPFLEEIDKNYLRGKEITSRIRINSGTAILTWQDEMCNHYTIGLFFDKNLEKVMVQGGTADQGRPHFLKPILLHNRRSPWKEEVEQTILSILKGHKALDAFLPVDADY